MSISTLRTDERTMDSVAAVGAHPLVHTVPLRCRFCRDLPLLSLHGVRLSLPSALDVLTRDVMGRGEGLASTHEMAHSPV